MPYKPLSHVALIFCNCNFDRLSELSINDFIWNINSGFTPRSSNLLQYHVDGFTLFSWSFIYAYLFFMFFIFGSFNCFHSQDQGWANVFYAPNPWLLLPNPGVRGEHLTSQLSWVAAWLLVTRVFPVYLVEELGLVLLVLLKEVGTLEVL